MITKKIIITLGLTVSFYMFCAAQQTHHIHHTQAELLDVHTKEISNSAYIFEGKIIKQTLKKGTLLTCNVIKITKIYKGSPGITLGTIKVFTEQSPNAKDGWKGLSNGSTYIIFGNPGDTASFHSIVTDNPFSISLIDYVFYPSPTTARWDATLYNSLDDLYTFFNQNGLTVQVQQTTPADSTRH